MSEIQYADVLSSVLNYSYYAPTLGEVCYAKQLSVRGSLRAARE